MVSVDVLDPAGYLSAMGAASGVLEAHAGGLDMLEGNGREQPHGPPEGGAASGPLTTPVPPVPAGGTGSDLSATLSAAVASADGHRDLASVCRAMSEGAAGAAAGRGGRALARFLDGLGEVFANADHIDGTRFALGLEAAAERLAPGDDGRHPGGFAAVANAAADAALDSADRGSELGETIVAAAGAGIEELERGPVLDARLASRGTVDAAAAGLLLVLDALASVVTGEPLPEPPDQSVTDMEDLSAVSPTRREPTRYELRCDLLAADPGVEAESDLDAMLGELCEAHHRTRIPSQGWTLDLVTCSPGAVVELLAGLGRMREVRLAALEQGVPDRFATTANGDPLVGTGG